MAHRYQVGGAVSPGGEPSAAVKALLLKTAVSALVDPQTRAAHRTMISGLLTIDVMGTEPIDERRIRNMVKALGIIDVADLLDAEAATNDSHSRVAHLRKMAATVADPALAAGYAQAAADAEPPNAEQHRRAEAAALKMVGHASTPEQAWAMHDRAQEQRHLALVAERGPGEALTAAPDTARALYRQLHGQAEVLRARLDTVAKAGKIDEPVWSLTITKGAGLGAKFVALAGDLREVRGRIDWLLEQPVRTGPTRIRPAVAAKAAGEVDGHVSKAASYDRLADSIFDPTVAAGYRELAAQERSLTKGTR